MKIFLDANVLISVLNNEYPLFTYSARVLSLADNKKYKVFIFINRNKKLILILLFSFFNQTHPLLKL